MTLKEFIDSLQVSYIYFWKLSLVWGFELVIESNYYSFDIIKEVIVYQVFLSKFVLAKFGSKSEHQI